MRVREALPVGGFALLLLTAGGCADADSPEAHPPAADSPAADRATLEEATAMLERAVAHYQGVGREQALRDFTAREPAFADRDLYVFCYGPDGTISAHGGDEALLGAAVAELRDVDGKALGTHILEVAAAHPEGGHASYKWTNPVTGEVEPKVSVVRAVGEDVCGVGAYGEAPHT